MKRLAWAALAATMVAGSATAQTEDGLSAAFAYSSIELAVLPMPDGREAYALETLVSVDVATGGPLAGLRGRCVVSGWRRPGAGVHEGAGFCVFADARGDRLVERIAEATAGPGTVVEGTGAWEGGTGRFAGATGEVRYSLVTYALSAPGRIEGTGRVAGTLLGVAHAGEPEAPEPPALTLRPAP